MVKKKNSSKKRNIQIEQETSLGEYVKYFFEKIGKLADSKNLSDRYVAYNSMILFLVLTFVFSNHFLKNFDDLFNVIIQVGVSGLIGAIVSLGYLFLIESINKLIKGDDFAHKIAISTLFIALTTSFLGFLYFLENLIEISLVIVVVQVIMLILFGFFKFPIGLKIKELKDDKVNVWSVLNKINLISGTINILIIIITFFIKFF